MNRLVVPKLQHLRLEIRSHWVYHSLLRMSEKLLIQRHGISYSRVDACYGFNKVSWAKSIPPPNFRNQKSSSSSNLIVNASKPRVGSGGYRSTSQIVQNSARSPLESWKLWQTMNCSVKDIGRRRGLTEFQVYEQICECVQQGKEIDWFELCQEAGFSPAIVLEINDAKLKAEEAMSEPLGQRLDEFGHVPVQCAHHVTDVHVLIYNTMMACGITPHEMFISPMEVPPTPVPERPPPASKKAPLVSKTVAESKRADVSRLSSETEDVDTKKTPKRLTQKHMLQWITDRNGATLMELVQEFQGYNECQLMRLILLLERKKLIQLSQGIFRVTSSEDEQTV